MARPKSLDREIKPSNTEDEVSQLRKQVEELTKLVMASQKVGGDKIEIPAENRLFADIPQNEYIKVMSLCNNKLNLSTAQGRQGKHYSFMKFGETRNIVFGDLLDINANHPNFLEAGYYLILDDRVIKSQGLEETYAHILTKVQIEQILSNHKDALSLFQVANPKQQKIVVDFIIQKMVANEPVDFNLVNSISKVSGVDINARVKAVQEINEIKNE